MTQRLIGSAVRELAESLIDDYENIEDMRHHSVAAKAKAEICKLREAGRPEEADWLTETLRCHRDIRNIPDRFEVTICPGNGRKETWSLVSVCDPLRQEDSPSQRPGANPFLEGPYAEGSPDPLSHQNENAMQFRPSTTDTVLPSMNENVTTSARMLGSAHEVDNYATENDLRHSGRGITGGQLRNEAKASAVAAGQTSPNIQQSIPVLPQIQRTPALIDVELDTFGHGIITFSKAREQKLWIGHNHSGKAFCLTCPCAVMVAPTGADFPCPMTEGTHHLIPRFFHLDPFTDNDALVHFRDVHKETFSDIGGMLRKYGSEIQTENIRLDMWAIAGHNMSIQLWQENFDEELREAKSKMLQQCQKADYLVHSKPRSIKRSKVPANNFVFSRPELHEEWIVYCPIPTCSEPNFVDDPLHDSTAIHHFQKHDMQLNDNQILNVFGLRVIPDLKSTNTHEPQHEPRSVNGLEPVPAVTQNGDQSVRPEAREVKKRPRRTCQRKAVPAAIQNGDQSARPQARQAERRSQRKRTYPPKARGNVEGKKYSPWIAGEQMIQYNGVKVERITCRRDLERGHGAINTQYEFHFAGCHKGEWVSISKLNELREIVESFDRGNGEKTPWLAKQKKVLGI
ncbi:hypothetical protein PFICI_09366 [Pestalotiopsis fici W106-1]|uniref:Uncharacterized protein n=1 Tax=Pestalotiopsis fici (strain W106-1 / CGMCC3.15140) TaxID=1229662 RepID=W3X044_PESFW|nr:uncharacterized protein PFICI_09366 [Pestalotiopsis fici W106-1]ETS79513.1 hypothetical protein PFICI_09366 [Pestalotiopsis fici W106-1]